MTFPLGDHWVWDSWLADDGQDYHLFFLRASRDLGDPEKRHRRASTGHAVSGDLLSWERTGAPALEAGPAGARSWGRAPGPTGRGGTPSSATTTTPASGRCSSRPAPPRGTRPRAAWSATPSATTSSTGPSGPR